MASWKKVHVEDANTVHGTITATLGDVATDINSGNLTAELVVSDGSSGGENELKTRSVSFGTAAFSATGDFATSTQGALADSALQDADMRKDLVAGTGLSGGTNNDVLYGADGDVTIALDINSLTASSGSITVASTDLVALYDTDGGHYKSTVSELVSAVSSGVTSVTGGDGLNVDQTTGAVTVSIDADQTTITSIYNTSLVVGNASDSENIDFSTDGRIGFDIAGTEEVFINASGIFPSTNEGASLGSGTNTWSNVVGDVLTGVTLNISGDATVGGDLTVNGDLTTINTTNLEVRDQFILLNDAAVATDQDSGIVFEGSTKTTAFGYDQSADRLAYMKTGASSGLTALTASAYIATAHTGAAIANVDTDFEDYGNIYTTSGGDIYIYS
jgi:putative surface-exposed virulence protein